MTARGNLYSYTTCRTLFVPVIRRPFLFVVHLYNKKLAKTKTWAVVSQSKKI